jgi:hypothetical protein
VRRDLAASRRNETIREAANMWLRARLIDEPVAAEISAGYPDDRRHRSLPWRALIFFFACVVASALFGFVALTLKPHSRAGIGMLLLFAGVLLLVATEVQSSILRFDGVGSESATSFLAITYLFYSGVLWFIPFARSGGGSHNVASALLLGTLCAAAAWRWGYALYALVATGSLLAAATLQFGGNRFALIAFAVLLALPSEFLRNRVHLPISHRMSLACVSGAGLAAIYAVVNRYSLDHRLIEQLASAGQRVEPAAPSASAQIGATIATAAFPLILLALGLRTRRRLLLDAGLLSGALSFLTLRQYVHLGPTWLVLCESGVVLTIAALATERILRRSPKRERAGVTADPELSLGGAPRGVEIAAVLWNLAPSAPAPKPGSPVGGGGSFGGGGATGGF